MPHWQVFLKVLDTGTGLVPKPYQPQHGSLSVSHAILKVIRAGVENLCQFFLLVLTQSVYNLLYSPAGVLGYPDGSVGAAIVAVVLVHCVIAGYVYVAWKEGQTPPVKQD